MPVITAIPEKYTWLKKAPKDSRELSTEKKAIALKGKELFVDSVTKKHNGHYWINFGALTVGDDTWEGCWIFPGHWDGLEAVEGVLEKSGGGASNTGGGGGSGEVSESTVTGEPNTKGEWLSTAPFEVDYQDTSYTCQSSMIQTVTDGAIDEAEARRKLQLYGNPGNPHIIGRVIREAIGDRYEYREGSINDMISVIKQGAIIGLQASVTEAGHVFSGKGYDKMADELKRNYPNHSELHEGINVIDPWTYYDWLKLRYTGKSMGYVGWYPVFGLWASAVKAWSFYEFAEYYRSNPTHDWKNDKGAYLHIIWPGK